MKNKAHSKNEDAQINPAPRTEHATPHQGLRDPQEPTQGPLRLDDLNYSPERMTLPEGNYNIYGDDETSSQDEQDLRPGMPDPQFPETSQSDILDSLPVDDTTIGREATPGGSQLQVGDSHARGDLVILDDIDDLLATLSPGEVAAIKVTVQQGTVTLEGPVGEASTPSRLAQAIEAIPGVVEICNLLHTPANPPRRLG